jgi:hypothetical protein
MAPSPPSRPPASRRKKRRRRFSIAALLPKARTRRRWLRALRRAPLYVRLTVAFAVAMTAWLTLNWTYQVVRKPSELWFPVSEQLYKTPEQTWRQYGGLFRRHSTSAISADVLAALAQIEGSGNPVARTYWRWALTHEPFEIYRPASSAVGMYQITDGTFAQARRYCVHDHVVVEDGPWHDWRSCWFNALYTRTVPSHAVEMTSAYLDRGIAHALSVGRRADATPLQKLELAAVIHLCGPGAAAAHVRRNFNASGQRCGNHDVRPYIERVNTLAATFARMRNAEGN